MKKVFHSGVEIDPAVDPKGAVMLCLNASAGCGSKARAWDWALEALDIARKFLPTAAGVLEKALGDDRWPDIAAAKKMFPS